MKSVQTVSRISHLIFWRGQAFAPAEPLTFCCSTVTRKLNILLWFTKSITISASIWPIVGNHIRQKILHQMWKNCILFPLNIYLPVGKSLDSQDVLETNSFQPHWCVVVSPARPESPETSPHLPGLKMYCSKIQLFLLSWKEAKSKSFQKQVSSLNSPVWYFWNPPPYFLLHSAVYVIAYLFPDALWISIPCQVLPTAAT